MKKHANPTDRNQMLRSQLVAMPIAAETRKIPQRKSRTDSGSLQPKRPRRKARVVYALAGVGVGLMVVGQLNLTAQSAHASEVLRATAEKTMKFTDPVPGVGQYLLVKTHANWAQFGAGTKPRLVA